jgi:hypothetical protein
MEARNPFTSRPAEILFCQDTISRSTAQLERDDLTPTKRALFEGNIRRAQAKLRDLLEAEVRA